MRLTRAGVLIAALGALLVMFDPFGLAVAGLVLAAVGARARRPWRTWVTRWYWLLAAGAILAVLSRLIAEGARDAGRLAGGDRVLS